MFGTIIKPKRLIPFLLAAVCLLSLSACGKSEYKYDLLDTGFPKNTNQYKSTARPIRGGALISAYPHDIFGENYVSGESTFPLFCIFDEEAKTLFPICFNAACTHETEECFANSFYGQELTICYGVTKDEIFVISDLHEEDGYKLHAYYYSLDGTLSHKVPLEDQPFIRPDGTEEDSVVFSTNQGAIAGNVIYFDACFSADTIKFDEGGDSDGVTHWLCGYDLETETMKVIASYVLPPESGQGNRIHQITSTHAALEYSGTVYVIELSTGKVTQTDYAEVLDGFIAQGKLPRGTELNSLTAPIDGIFSVKVPNEKKSRNVNLNTGEIAEITPMDKIVYSGYDHDAFVYNGRLYNLESGSSPTLTDIDSGEQFAVELPPSLSLYRPISETENGLIYAYLNLTPQGEPEPTSQTVTVNGVETRESFPKKLIYFSKEDLMDGKIDSPLFYDAGLYTFTAERR